MTRLDKLRNVMREKGLDALLITSPFNLRYISNFTGTTGLSLITLDKAYFVTDFRYTQQAAEQAVGFEVVQNYGSIYDEVARIVSKKNLNKVGFEENFVTFSLHQLLTNLITSELVPVTGIVEELREVKDADEIATIKKACEIADSAFQFILGEVKTGMTEIEVANKLDFHMRGLGATGVSFETIVASGIRSSMPHGVASDKLIEMGDMITLDFGCYYNGYVSDMTRTFAIGDPGQKMKDIYQLVLDAQLMVNEAAKPGITGVELDAIARNYFAKHGVAEAFGHSTGHGIGLEIHEGPSVSRLAEKAFVPGNVITNEPGLYFPNLGGVRIEDDLVITETGNEIIVHSPKELIIL